MRDRESVCGLDCTPKQGSRPEYPRHKDYNMEVAGKDENLS